MYMSLKQNGIEMFDEQFVFLTADNINSLDIADPNTGARVPLDMGSKMLLRSILSFYHHASHIKQGGINILDCTEMEFREFRATVYDQSKPLVPWASMSNKDDALVNWNKSIKPNSRDYKLFRDANGWLDYKEGFKITTESQYVGHLIGKNYKVTNPEME